ncbi:hypothetical protein N7444_000001 [Penicillium canescens]|nr:hypothetical protein N7444_000001 [Penicillium canescens]
MASTFLQKVTSLPKSPEQHPESVWPAKSLAQRLRHISRDINLDKLEEAAAAISAETPEARVLITALDIRD